MFCWAISLFIKTCCRFNFQIYKYKCEYSLLVPVPQTTQVLCLHELNFALSLSQKDAVEGGHPLWSAKTATCSSCVFSLLKDGSVSIPPPQPLNCQWLRNPQSYFDKEGQKGVPSDCSILVKNWLCILIMQIFPQGLRNTCGVTYMLEDEWVLFFLI